MANNRFEFTAIKKWGMLAGCYEVRNIACAEYTGLEGLKRKHRESQSLQRIAKKFMAQIRLDASPFGHHTDALTCPISAPSMIAHGASL